jgi:hypothetical protein
MSSQKSTHVSEFAGRLKDLEHFTGTLVPRREPETDPVAEEAPRRVPVPRRSRVFLRHGEGHGVFADLTLTAPRPRPAAD